jgi:hypothetical protein
MIWNLLTSLPFLIPLAVIGGVAAVAVWLGAVLAVDRAFIAFEARPLKVVRQFFRQRYPNERIGNVNLVATEPSRWIVRVSYGEWRPPFCKCFAVDRPSEEVAELEDSLQDAPRGMR